jgi:hypothetical protein
MWNVHELIGAFILNHMQFDCGLFILLVTMGSESNYNVFLTDAHLEVVYLNVKSASHPLLSLKPGTCFVLRDVVYGG